MNNKTNIDVRAGQIGVDHNMLVPTIHKDARRAPTNIIKVRVDRIHLPKGRHRNADPKMVKMIQDDIRKIGLLQPIGLRKQKDHHDYELMWGLHRYLAFVDGWEHAQALIEERTDKDPEAFQEATMWQSIPAVIHDWMPNDDAEMKEISENLHRKTLTVSQEQTQRARYATLVKKLG